MSASRNSEEVVSSHRTEVLQDVTRRVNEVYILNRETNRVCKEGEARDDPAKKLEQNPFPKKMKLNVGGHIFLTRMGTLHNAPSGSMLEAMFSGRFDTKPSEDGCYFVDRDGTHFRYILNYFRTGHLIVPEDRVLLKELLAEAQLYQIEGIINEIDELKAKALRDFVRLSSEPGVSNL